MSAAAMPAHSSLASSALAAELWVSLASLLHSHVAMHSVTRPDVKLRLASKSKSELELLGPIGKLLIVGPDASGIGATEFRPEAGELGDEYSTFFFTEDGMVHFESADDAPVSEMDMEAAVEHWLRKVSA